MNDYLKFSHTNNFNNLFGCFDNLNTCLMGCCCPCCLFGYIYEKLEKGSCLIGGFKFFSLNFIISSIFNLILYLVEWNILIIKQLKINEDLKKSKINCYNTSIIYNKTKIFDNNCLINNTEICDYMIQPIINECKFNQNLPVTINNLIEYITFIGILQSITICIFMGLFLGYYRTQLSHKYNILYNSRYNFLIHCNPFTNLCALCQEYNSIERIEKITPINPVSKKFIL